MQIYLAARYSRREELCKYREELRQLGHKVQARWLDGNHQLSNEGVPLGDDGVALIEGDDSSTDAALLRSQFAKDDWDDVRAASLVICFTEPPRSNASRGGRHVEFGIALMLGAKLIVVGYRENIFYWLPKIEFFRTWEDARASIPWLRGAT